MSGDTYMSPFRHIGPGALAGAHEVGSIVIRTESSLPAPTAQALSQSVSGFGVRRPMYREAFVVESMSRTFHWAHFIPLWP
jgi:hypothetical protein